MTYESSHSHKHIKGEATMSALGYQVVLPASYHHKLEKLSYLQHVSLLFYSC